MFAVQVEGSDQERRIVHFSSEKAVVGRQRTCEIQLDNDTVSRQHTEIVQTSQGFVVRDLGSHNGTFVNGRWITETRAFHGDEVRIGRYTLTLICHEEPKEREPVQPLPVESVPMPRNENGQNRFRTLLTLGLLLACAAQATLLFYLLYGGSQESAPQDAGEGPPVKQSEPVVNANSPGKVETSGVENPGDATAVIPAPSITGNRVPGPPQDPQAKGAGALAAEQKKQARTVRPSFMAAHLDLPARGEILLRRIYLDLLGRPPIDAELDAVKDQRIASVVRELVAREDFRRTWPGGAEAVVRSVWADREKTFSSPDAAMSHLAALYQHGMDKRPVQTKDVARLVRSFFVDVWLRPPETTEVSLFKEQMGAVTADRIQYPLSVFFLGEVAAPENPEQWISRMFVRFLLREPAPAEVKAALGHIQTRQGLRGFLLGLASSDAYLHY